MNANPLPPLTEEELERLRVDIEANGILDPVEVCAETGDLLDGWHRRQIAAELGIECPQRLIEGLHSDDEREAWAYRRNSSRGVRDPKVLNDGKKALFARLRAAGKTQAQCAGMLGVSQGTISKWEKANISNIPGNNPPDARVKLTDDDIDDILHRVCVDGDTQASVAADHNVDPTRVSQIVNERRVDYLAALVKFPTTVAGVAIHHGDARDGAPEGAPFADLAIFSPPYNVGIDYDADDTDDGLSDEEWQSLLVDVVKELTEDWTVGRIAINVPAALDRNPYRPITLPDFGLDLEGVIVWDKATTGNRTSWGSWRSPSAPRLRDRTERIYVYRTPHELRIDGLEKVDGKSVSPLMSQRDFTTLTQDLWSFPPAQATNVGHPAPFPVELPRRLIQLYGWPGCTVVDPFAGSGTTGIAAVELGVDAHLIERSETYCRLAYRRLLEVTR